ncbi:sigma-70 family RNA polymerase sigma factor [bacterium]|nr:sigma-70 family RNA polymerase sigma factor [bacterium]
MHKSDEELMILYQRGEFRAFEELYSRYAGRIYGYFKNRLSSPGEAEDLVQQTFLKFHQGRASYNGVLPLLPWLFSIARNLLVDYLRKHRPVTIEVEKLLAIAEKAVQEEAAEPTVTWDSVMKLLPDEQRKLIQLRFDDGMSFEEIAKLSGINETSARKRVNRTVQSLRKIFGVKKGRHERG